MKTKIILGATLLLIACVATFFGWQYCQQKKSCQQNIVNIEAGRQAEIDQRQREVEEVRKELVGIEEELKKQKDENQKNLQERNDLIKRFRNSKTRESENPRDWQLYRDEELGIEFRYPNEWVEDERELVNVKLFNMYPVYTIGIQMNVLREDKGRSLKQIVQEVSEIKTGSPCGHIIESNPSSELFVTACSAGSEVYHYIFKTNKGDVIEFEYKNDFEESWSEKKKLKRFRKIISTIKVF